MPFCIGERLTLLKLQDVPGFGLVLVRVAEEIIPVTVIYVDAELAEEGDGSIMAIGVDRAGNRLVFHGDGSHLWSSFDRPTEEFVSSKHPMGDLQLLRPVRRD